MAVRGFNRTFEGWKQIDVNLSSFLNLCFNRTFEGWKLIKAL